MLRLQAEEIRQAAAEREREVNDGALRQSLVNMWHALVHVEVDGEATPAMTVEAYIRNTSPQPIYDLWFEWTMFTDSFDRIDDKTYCGEAPLMPGAMAAARAPGGTGTYIRISGGRQRGCDIPRSRGRMVADPREWVP